MFEKFKKAISSENSGENETPVPKKVDTEEKVVVSAGGLSGLFGESSGGISTNYLNYYQGWVYTNIDVIARSVAKIELDLYKINLKNGELDYVEVNSHAALELIDRFNDATSKSDGIYLTQTNKDIFGDAFWIVDPVEGIFLVRPDKMIVNFSTNRETGQVEVTGYTYEDVIEGEKIKINYEIDQVVPFKYPNPANPVRGKSPIEAGLLAIDTDFKAEEFNRRFFENNATPDTLFTTDQKLLADQVQRLETTLKRRFGGVKNAHKTMILSGGLKAEQLNTTQRDMEFNRQLMWTRDKIMAIFGNTKVSLGITEDVNRANAEASLYLWLKESIKPRMQQICDALNEFYLPIVAPGENLIFGFDDPYPEDKAEDVDMAVKGYNKWLTRNEIREMLDLDPVGGGDEFTSEQPDVPAPAEEMPKSVKNVNYKKRLRQLDIYEKAQKQKDTRKLVEAVSEASVGIAKELVARKKKAHTHEPEPSESKYFTNEEVWNYHEKKIESIEPIEARFEGEIIGFLNKLEEKTLGKLAKIEQKGLHKVAGEPLIDFDVEVKAGIDLFSPLFEQATLSGGMQAMALMGMNQNYKPSAKVQKQIKADVRKFTESMISTDRDKLTDILVNGFNSGDGVDVIAGQIRDAFDVFRKNQARTISRTEIMRAANNASIDAYSQSDVVVGKQWLTAQDERTCPECAPLNGKIVKLNKDFWSTDGEFEGGNPPRHPNCRCDVLPVLADEKILSEEVVKEYKDKLKKVKQDKKDTVDKLSKDYQKLQEEVSEAKQYAEELERLLDV